MIGTFGCLYSWVFLVCLYGFLIIVRFSCFCCEVNCGCTGVCYTMHFPLRNIRHQIFVERNWINTTGHYFYSSANFCPSSSFSSSKYRTVNVFSYRTLQYFNPVGNYCALIFRFAQFFVGKIGFSYSQLQSNSYFFVFINLTLGSLKSKLIWDYGWRPTFPAFIVVVVCIFIIVLWSTSYLSFTLESINLTGISPITYAGFYVSLASSAPIATNFLFIFSKFLADLLWKGLDQHSLLHFGNIYCKTQPSSLIFMMYPSQLLCNYAAGSLLIHCNVRSRF